MEKIPEYININNVAIPTSQKFWDENRKMKEKINQLKRAVIILGIALATLSVALFTIK